MVEPASAERLLRASVNIAMGEAEPDREQALRELAAQLLFDVRKDGSRFSLCREAGLAEPVRSDNLTLEEAEELLNTWKLRGLHGG